MPKPDWITKQNPGQKSKDHGKTGGEHDNNGRGHDGHGFGLLLEPGERKPKQDPGDLTVQEPEEGDAGAPELAAGLGIEPLAGTAFPAAFYIGQVPPVQNQGHTPHCVAYSNAYDQNQHDRPESGHFWNMDEAKFFAEIEGTANGAYMSKGLIRRRDVGYPEALNVPGQDANPNRGRHRIAGYVQIPITVTAIKEALMRTDAQGRHHGVLVIGDWFHSWNHPLASGKLPAPDYRVAGHARWWRGWNDAYGFRERESFGTSYGLAGDCLVPYAFLNRLYAAYRTNDK